MRYTYDPKKRVANLKKHGYDFKHAPQVIESAASVTFEDRRFDYDEQRFITLGMLRSGGHRHRRDRRRNPRDFDAKGRTS